MAISKRSNRLLLMLKAFIDDSNMNTGPVFVLGGWIAPAQTRAAFSDAWQEALRMSPRIEYFKLTEALNFNGEFNGLSEKSRDEKLTLLMSIIDEFKLTAVCSVSRMQRDR